MIRKFIGFGIATLITTNLYADMKKAWSYESTQDWENINPTYLGCADGNQQSPINIMSKEVQKGAMEFQLQYAAAKGVNLTLENATFIVTYPQGSFLQMGGMRYQLKKIFFKTPSEHAINSLHTPIEAQLLHEDSKGNKVILSVFFADGKTNPFFESLTKNLPTQPNKAHFITNINIKDIIPQNLSSYQYDGSLTFPPCSQNVRWIVLKTPVAAAPSQAESLRDITKANARSVQKTFNRLIVEE